MESHLLKASCNKRPIVLVFPICLVLLCLIGSLFLKLAIPFGEVVHHPFFGGHVLNWFAHRVSFCASSLSGITLFYMGFSFLYFPFPCQWHSYHWTCLCFFFLSWLLWGLWFSPINVATLLWPSVGVKPNTWKKWGFGVLRDSWMFRVRQQGPKHLALRCFWCHWKGLEA